MDGRPFGFSIRATDRLPLSSSLMDHVDRVPPCQGFCMSNDSREEDEGNEDANSMAESDAVSVALSAMSVFDPDVIPIDSERYAKICAKIERLQSGITKREVKLSKAKAKLREQRKHLENLCSNVDQVRAELVDIGNELACERRLKTEAIEKAAAALDANELLRIENAALQQREQKLADQLRSYHMLTTQKSDTQLEFAAQVRELKDQLNTQERKLHEADEERQVLLGKLKKHEEHAADLTNQKRILEMELEKMPSKDEQMQREQSQQQKIQDVEADRRQLLKALNTEREENKRHSAYLMKVILQLEAERGTAQTAIKQQKQQQEEARELGLMLNEEIQSQNDQVCHLKSMLKKQQLQHQQTMGQYQELAKEFKDLDASRRRMISVFIPTRKHLSSISTAMSRLSEELHGVCKTVALGRFREAALGRVLREYGRRNRELQSSLGFAKQKLRSVASALRSSEQRKTAVIATNASLKRDLVTEKCQRLDLLRECQELSACLDKCQGVASKTQAQADTLHQENDSLQLTVQQLIAYAQALAQSQQSLEHELRQLEVEGLREPAVFG